MCIDGLFGGNWTTYINDGPHSGITENVYFEENGTIFTLTDIKKGDELFISYGKNIGILHEKLLQKNCFFLFWCCKKKKKGEKNEFQG